MSACRELRQQIEAVREELNRSIVQEQYEVYYAKSVELDKLIEKYIEIQTK